MMLGFEIDRCNDCPFFSYEALYEYYSYLYYPICKKSNTYLSGKMSNSNFDIIIPDWCPCKIEI